MPLDNVKLAQAVSTTEKLVRRMDVLESRRKDDYGHPVKSQGNRVQQTDYGRGDALTSSTLSYYEWTNKLNENLKKKTPGRDAKSFTKVDFRKMFDQGDTPSAAASKAERTLK